MPDTDPTLREDRVSAPWPLFLFAAYWTMNGIAQFLSIRAGTVSPTVFLYILIPLLPAGLAFVRRPWALTILVAYLTIGLVVSAVSALGLTLIGLPQTAFWSKASVVVYGLFLYYFLQSKRLPMFYGRKSEHQTQAV